MITRRIVVAALVAAFLIPTVGNVQSAEGIPPILRLADVKPGMKGIGRTVVRGQRVEEFNFEVIGILRGGGGSINSKHLILFRASGPMIDRIGGTAAGMSGSPLYINGKIVGALSAGYINVLEKRDIALATPIEEMLPVLDRSPGNPQGRWPRTFTATQPIRLAARPLSTVVIVRDAAQAAQVERARLPGVSAFVPATAPVTTSGLSPRAQKLIEKALGLPEPLQQYAVGSEEFPTEPIVAGSSVGILQVRGDIVFGGICTVTLRVGDRLLICGHPWDDLGDVEYALTASDIITVIRVLERPFKEFNLGEVIGKVDQDRGTAIRGVMAQYPHMFTVRVEVTNQDTGTVVRKGMQVIRRRDLATAFATAITLTAFDRARDQTNGGGTAKVRITVRAKGLPRDFVRENVFYSSRDIGVSAAADLPDSLNFLFHNDLAAIEPIDARIEVTFSGQRTTAAITGAKVERREVAPGETLHVQLNVRPFQGAQQPPRVINLPVPRNFPRGPAVLTIGPAGGLSSDTPADARLMAGLTREPDPVRGNNLNDAMEFIEEFGKNTDISIQLLPYGLPAEGSEFLKFDVSATRFVQTDWVIQGTVQIPILVK